MSNRTDGTARAVSPQRLANFEDGDLDLELAPPPRPRREKNSPAPDALPAPRKSRKAPQKASTAPVAGAGATAAHEEPEQSTSPQDGPDEASAPTEVTGKGLDQRVRRSNVHIPVRLIGPISEKTEREGLSNGEIIIAAIEQTYDQLPTLIHPAPTTGGNLFDSRRSRVSRSTDGPLTPLNYGLREVDFETLDRLVEQLRASSRGHLITAALSAYFAT